MYSTPLPDYGTLMTVDEFRADVRSRLLIDYDGFGHPVRNGRLDQTRTVYPSQVHRIPPDATHIHWYNR